MPRARSVRPYLFAERRLAQLQDQIQVLWRSGLMDTDTHAHLIMLIRSDVREPHFADNLPCWCGAYEHTAGEENVMSDTIAQIRKKVHDF